MEPCFHVRDRNSKQKMLLTHQKLNQIAGISLTTIKLTAKKTASTTQKVRGDAYTLDKTVVSLI